MFKKIISLFVFLTLFNLTAQTVQLSAFSEVSIITSGPGDNLYEKFGHTAIRVKDPVLSLDILYNYGIFDFDAPNFYLNFTKGFMKYKLMGYPFHYALKSANDDKRWVKQQILNLTKEERTAFFIFLQQNSQPENASYLYDPFFDNCATKPRDIIQKVLGEKLIITDDFIEKEQSFRQLMNNEINMNTWGSFGINVALGSKLDKIANANEYMYLPDYFFKALEAGKIKRETGEVSLVKSTKTLLEFVEKPSKSDMISPFWVFSVFLLIGAYFTFKDYKNNKRTKWLDFVVFFSTGLTGFILVFLWFFTNHSTAPNNFNVLWAFAPNLFVAFILLQNKLKTWISKYSVFLLILLFIIPVIWLTKIQLFTWQLLPLFLLLTIRYVYLASYKKL